MLRGISDYLARARTSLSMRPVCGRDVSIGSSVYRSTSQHTKSGSFTPGCVDKMQAGSSCAHRFFGTRSSLFKEVRMLILSRKRGETIVIGADGEIKITVMEVRENRIRLGIIAPKETVVHRKEVYDVIYDPEQKAE
jgi:carbon storage regulator